jgi:hypothetical protein
VSEVVELERNRDARDLAADRRDPDAEPQAPEVARLAQGADVDRDAGETAALGRFGPAGLCQ